MSLYGKCLGGLAPIHLGYVIPNNSALTAAIKNALKDDCLITIVVTENNILQIFAQGRR